MAARLAVFALLIIGTALAYGAQAARTPADAATISPSGVDSTGTQDDTATLQAMIDSLPDGSTLAFPAGGKYRIEGTLHVKNKNNLTIEGNGSLFFATTKADRTRSQWSFEAGSNIVVRDVVVKGANPHAGTSADAYVASLEAQHAFNIWSTNGIELDHVSATDVYGDFVYVGLQAGRLAKNVFIHDSTFARNGRQGISVAGGDGVRILHNTITDTRRATFDLEPNGPTWGAFNVDIENNTIGPGRLNLLSSAGVGPVSNITFAHNRINRGANMQMGDTNGGRRGPYTISDNVATANWGSSAGSGLLHFSNIDGLTVTGNTMPLQAGRGDYGVKASDSCNVLVTNNNFAGAVAPATVTPGPSCTSTGGAPPPPPVSIPTTTPSAAPTNEPSPAPTPTPTLSAAPTHKTSPAPTPTLSAAPTHKTSPAPTPTTTTASAAPTHKTSPAPTTVNSSRHATSNPKPTSVAARATVPVKSNLKRTPQQTQVSASTSMRTPATIGAMRGSSVLQGMLITLTLAAAAVVGLVGIRPKGTPSPTDAGTAQRHRVRLTTGGGLVNVPKRHRVK